MKRLLIFLPILCLISCTQYNDIETVVQIQDRNVSSELVEQTHRQVVERLKKAGFENIKLGRGTSPISFKVSTKIEAKNENKLAEYHDAFKRSKFGMWSKFKMIERDIDSLKITLEKEIPELSIHKSWKDLKLSYNIFYFSNKKNFDNLLYFTNEKDVDNFLSIKKKFNSLLKEYKNIGLFWSATPIELSSQSEYYELHIIDTQSQSNARITNEHIKEATGKAGMFFDTYVVNILLNEEGGSIFEKMTRENIGEEIAITIDDKVYSAPVIQGAIDGGKVEISGAYTLEEAKRTAALFKQPPLPYTLKIIDEKITTPE